MYGRIADDVAMRRQIIKELLKEFCVDDLDITYNDIMLLSVA